MHAYLTTQRPNHTGCWSRIKAMMAKRCILIAGKVYGNYLTFLYLVIKLLYLCNCVGQVFLLGFILNTDYYMFGIHVLKSLLRAQEWHESNRFPRVTLCDFEVRELGNIHRHTVQCVLPINLFNEKIYVFLWFWFAFVSFFTLTSFLHWTKQSLQRSGQVKIKIKNRFVLLFLFFLFFFFFLFLFPPLSPPPPPPPPLPPPPLPPPPPPPSHPVIFLLLLLLLILLLFLLLVFRLLLILSSSSISASFFLFL